MALIAPGLVFAAAADVAPDVVWVSRERLAGMLDRAGHLTKAPELVVEVLSPGKTNERRERGALKLAATLYADDALESPMLPGFSCRVAKLFFTQPS